MKKYVLNNLWNILIWGTISLFTILYISLIFNINVTTDEIFTLKLIKENLGGIIQGTADDVHPPLYYFYAKIFELISPQNIHLQKFVTIIPMTGLFIYVGLHFRKYIGDMATFFSLLFFGCVPCTMEYAVQIRMYSLAMLCVTVCAVSAYEAYTTDKKSAWILMVITADAAAYLHYFSFVAVCFIVGILFLCILFGAIKKKNTNADNIPVSFITLRTYFISIIAMIIIYLPWLPVFFTQVTRTRESYWIAPITGEVIWSYFTWAFDLELFPGFVYAYLFLLITTGMYGLIRLIRMLLSKEGAKADIDAFSFLCMLIPTLTSASGIIISLTKSPIFCGRYVIVAIMLLSMWWGICFSHVIEDIKNKHIKTILILLVTAFLLISGAVQYKECFRQEYRNGYTESTVNFFKENLGENDYVLYNYKAMEFVFDYYFPEGKLVYVEDFDLGSDYDNAWFLYTLNEWPITPYDCLTYDLNMTYIGYYGFEGCDVDLFKVSHNE